MPGTYKEKIKVAIVIPCYNEGQVIAAVIHEVKAAGNFAIIVIDDGSFIFCWNRIIDEKIIPISIYFAKMFWLCGIK